MYKMNGLCLHFHSSSYSSYFVLISLTLRVYYWPRALAPGPKKKKKKKAWEWR